MTEAERRDTFAADHIPELVAAAAEEVGPQVVLAEVPAATLARADELAAALTGPAVRSVLRIRAEQIVEEGHDRDSDSMLPLSFLPKRARSYLDAAVEHITGTTGHRDLAIARSRIAKAAALCLAAIDRLDMATAGGER